jgi:hypothetical protein
MDGGQHCSRGALIDDSGEMRSSCRSAHQLSRAGPTCARHVQVLQLGAALLQGRGGCRTQGLAVLQAELCQRGQPRQLGHGQVHERVKR